MTGVLLVALIVLVIGSGAFGFGWGYRAATRIGTDICIVLLYRFAAQYDLPSREVAQFILAKLGRSTREIHDAQR